MRTGKKKSILRHLQHAVVGCLLAIGVCAVAFAADPTQLLGDDFGSTKELIANVSISDVDALKPYMEDVFIQRVEDNGVNYGSEEFLAAYLEVDETFIFTVQRYLDNTLV